VKSPGPGHRAFPDLFPGSSQRGENPERTNCFYCGRPLGFLARIRGERWFCSPAHHKAYRQHTEQLAMESLAWNSAARLRAYVAAAEKPRRAPEKRRSELAGFVHIGARPSAGVASVRVFSEQPLRRKLVPSAAMLPEPFGVQPQLAPAAAMRPAILPAEPAVAITPACTPAGFVLRPSLPARALLLEFSPGSAKAVARSLEMIRSAGPIRLREKYTIGAPESEVDFIGTLGVNDPDEAPVETMRPEPVPAVIGDPVVCEPESVIQLAAQRTLRLRRSSHRAQGLFIPKMRMGTLRPRVAFGPSGDRRRVIPIGSRASQRQTAAEAAARAHSA